jgi:hypothetical protein
LNETDCLAIGDVDRGKEFQSHRPRISVSDISSSGDKKGARPID